MCSVPIFPAVEFRAAVAIPGCLFHASLQFSHSWRWPSLTVMLRRRVTVLFTLFAFDTLWEFIGEFSPHAGPERSSLWCSYWHCILCPVCCLNDHILFPVYLNPLCKILKKKTKKSYFSDFEPIFLYLVFFSKCTFYKNKFFWRELCLDTPNRFF